MIGLLLMVTTIQMGGGAALVERVCLPANMKNIWVIIEYSRLGRAVDGEVTYVVPASGYVKVPFKTPSLASKVLVKVGDSPFVDATSSPNVHVLRRLGEGTATTDGKSTRRDFMIFFYGDEKGLAVDAWDDHIPK